MYGPPSKLASKFKVPKRLQNTVNTVKKWQKVGFGGGVPYIYIYILWPNWVWSMWSESESDMFHNPLVPQWSTARLVSFDFLIVERWGEVPWLRAVWMWHPRAVNGCWVWNKTKQRCPGGYVGRAGRVGRIRMDVGMLGKDVVFNWIRSNFSGFSKGNPLQQNDKTFPGWWIFVAKFSKAVGLLRMVFEWCQRVVFGGL